MQFLREENGEMKNMAGASHVFSPENQIKGKDGGSQGGFYGVTVAGPAYLLGLNRFCPFEAAL